jgi:hypothetical protein
MEELYWCVHTYLRKCMVTELVSGPIGSSSHTIMLSHLLFYMRSVSLVADQ